MLRQIVVPDKQDYVVHLPKSYVNHKVEIIAFSIDQEITPKRKTKKFGLGCMKGKIKMAEDFDEPLEDFKEYM